MKTYLIVAFTLLLFVASVFSSRLKFAQDVPSATANVRSMNQDASLNVKPSCSEIGNDKRFDCYPGQLVDQTSCEARGCCWKPVQRKDNVLPYAPTLRRPINVPYCYFPADYNGYQLSDTHDTVFGQSASLKRSTASGWPNDVSHLQIDVYYETATRLRFKIYDPSNKRYEVPIATPPFSTKAKQADYQVKLTPPCGISVIRKSTGAILFNSGIAGAPLIFADQFIQISTLTGTGLVYGLGEHKAPFLKRPQWDQYAFWARDHGPAFETNLYGSHPFYVNLESDGKAHGVFLLNSNAMDVDIHPVPAVTFRTIGGILDFYVFTGDTPDLVVQQYTDVIGKPIMPPYWGLGFHLCRYDYKNSTNMKEVIRRNRAIGIPYEVQWNDIDYMDKYLDWTYDPRRYSDLPEIVNDLHDQDQKYIIIVDPGISNMQPSGEYAPYDEGVTANIFIKDFRGKLLNGTVWPGPVAFPDFTNPKTDAWWYNQAKRFHDEIPYDGLWTDMNEPSNFVFGSASGCSINSTLDNPPYTPGIDGEKLAQQTVCPSAQQYLGTHYDVHNLYGLTEVRSTNNALRKIRPGKRPVIISRSTFPSEGHYGSHWSGDVHSTWEDMHYSIPSILNFQLFGISFVGADICGFTGDTTEEMCVRWMQLGAFYPFMRNHNDRNYKDQDPAAFSAGAQAAIHRALDLRYYLLPYMYTRFHESHLTGAPVVRPLVFQYPLDKNTYSIDRQFLWGSEMLVTPVLEQGATKVKAYLPADRWYPMATTAPCIDSKGEWVTLDAPMDNINRHIRGGSILPLGATGLNTVQTRKQAFKLVVAPNKSGFANGTLYWDEGDTLDAYESSQYTLIRFEAESNKITSTPVHVGYKPEDGMKLASVIIWGQTRSPKQLSVNGKKMKFTYDKTSQMVNAQIDNINLLSSITIRWT